MNKVAKSAFAFVIGLIGCWIVVSAARATTFDLGQIHPPAEGRLSASQGAGGAPGFVDFPADQYDFTVNKKATLTASFGLSVNVSQQSPSDYLDLSLHESDSSGTHLLTTATDAHEAVLTFEVDPGHFYSFLVATGFVNNPPEVGGYGGITIFALVPTPIPAALPLFASALGGLGVVGWKRRKRLWVAGA
jgi:hypothetical protein